MSVRRILAGALLTALVAVLAGVGATAASAQSGTYLRLAHLSPDTPAVDVLVTGFDGRTLRLAGVNYGDVSTYQRIEPGSYTLQMRPAGAPESTPPVVTGTLDAQAGSAYTAAGLGNNADLAVRVLPDDLTLPPAGQARMRVIQGAPESGTLSVGWQGGTPLADITFAQATDYVSVPAGTGNCTVTGSDGTEVEVPVDLEAGAVYSLILVERDGEITGSLQTDALSSGEVPTGGIDTGLGGTAGPSDGGIGLVAGLVTASAVGVAAVALGARRGLVRK